ncbi:hypothetical protein [Lutibacter citreus]|uniref:hypothetical protein n=1 Tax=Lutibacter citreus TaxID=2138210 RepID=UPI0013006DD1|nr:hypothetical protein [Lutibacter citreus]
MKIFQISSLYSNSSFFHSSKRCFKLSLLLFIGLFLGVNSLYGQSWDRFPTESEIKQVKNKYISNQKNIINKKSRGSEGYTDETIIESIEFSSPIKHHRRDLLEKTRQPYEVSGCSRFNISGLVYAVKITEKRTITYDNIPIWGKNRGKKDIHYYHMFGQPYLSYEYDTESFYLNDGGYFLVSKYPDPENVSIGQAYNDLRNEIIKGDIAPGFAPKLDIILNENSSPSSEQDPAYPDSEDDEFPWEVIIGGAALGAAIVAIRKRLKKSKNSKKKSEKDEEKAGYVLQLNKEEFSLKPNESKTLTAKVWKITEKGKSLANATIKIQNSEKALKVMPFSAVGTLNSQLSLKDKPKENQFYITVTASVDGHSYQKQVRINAGMQNRLIIETAPGNTRSLRPNIDQNLTCFAQVVDADDNDIPELTKKIKFDNSKDRWVDLLDEGPYFDEGWAAILVGASDPKGEYDISHPPKSVTLDIYVEYKEEEKDIRLENNLEIQLLDCMLETNLEDITFPVSEEKSEVTCKAFIENCDGEIPWKFKAIYMKDYETPDSEPLTEIAIEEVSETKVNITLTGPIIEPKEGEKYLRKLFVISAQQKEEKPLERHIYVMVTKEGLFIESGVTKNNEITFLAKGDFKDKLEFSLNWYNPETDQMEVDKKALQNLSFELVSDNKVEKNINTVLEPKLYFEKFITTMHHGYYSIEVPNKFPGFGDVYNLKYLVKAPVSNTENPKAFEQIITLKVQSYGMGDKFPAWEKAYNDCKTTIYDYFKDSKERNKLLDMLERNKDKFDVEGMVAFRKKIWLIAHDLMINEAEKYISEANSYDAIIDTLEWVVWMGDIAFQVVVSTYLGPFTGFGASTFKEITLTGYGMVIEGKSVDDFIDAQISSFKEVLFSVAKGGVINTRNIEKIYKGNKIKVWAIYAVATFAISYGRTKSIPEAAKMTARQLRDELIIVFLNGQVQKGQARLKAENEKKVDAKNNPKDKTTVKDQKGTKDYVKDPNPPDVSGYTSSSIKSIQRVANKFKARIITRPTTGAARRLLNSGEAVPKKMFVKNKTINALDTFLGASKKNIGKVGSFKPKLSRQQIKKLPKAMRREIVKRYRQRSAEYTDQAQHIIENYDKLYVKKGVVYDRLTGKPFTGDIDVFDIRGANGQKLPPERINKIINELRKSNVKTNIEHGAHVEWDWRSIKDPNDRRIAKEIYEKIIGTHTMDGDKSIAQNVSKKGKKESLVQFDPGTSKGVKIKSVLYKG